MTNEDQKKQQEQQQQAAIRQAETDKAKGQPFVAAPPGK
jgi:hypothetical protein